MDLRDMIIRGIRGQGGGTAPSVEWNDVTFIDYDGSVLYSYSLEEAQTLAALPALPERDGLICQGWNWTLEEIKALNRPITVGAMYITDDGATRLYIRIAAMGRMTVPLSIIQTVENGVSIDWGDGSMIETLSGTGSRSSRHTYAEPGDYIISLLPKDECILSLDDLLGISTSENKIYQNMLQRIHIGKNVTSIGEYGLSNYCSLASITIPNNIVTIEKGTFANSSFLANIIIPNSVTTIRDNAFYGCLSLTNIIIPNSVTSIGMNVFQDCHTLAKITIPNSIISMGDNAFQNCYSLSDIVFSNNMASIGNSICQSCKALTNVIMPNGITSIGDRAFYTCSTFANIIIPSNITSIGSFAFYSCAGVRYYDFSACTSIPTLLSTDAFGNIPYDCQMLIPAALFDEWSAATNWTTYKNKMIAV